MGLFDFFKKPPEPDPEKKPPTPKPKEEEPVGFFAGLKRALKKTSDILNTDVRDLFKKEGRLVDEQFLTELFAILVKTDMGVGPAARIRDKIGTDFRARVVHMPDILAVVKSELRELLAQPEKPVNLAPSGPTVILVVGVNGSGENDFYRQTDAAFSLTREKSCPGSCRHFSRRCRRSADDLGGSAGGRNRKGCARRRSSCCRA